MGLRDYFKVFDRFRSKKERELKGETEPVAIGEAKKETEAPKKLKVTKGGIIVKPLITEKASVIAHSGQYCFQVSRQATRTSVKEAVKKAYGVAPVSVNIQNVRGKATRFGRIYGRRSTRKKAIVTLPKGKTIEVYEGV